MIKLARSSVMVALVAGSVVASPAALAELTANAALTSNYVWRGATQTDDGAALQGGVDYAHDSGVYVGAWASNVEEGLEYDLYAGFANEVGGFGYDVGYLTYSYTDEDFWPDMASEIKLGVSYSVASLNYYIGDNGADTDNEYTYTEVGFDFELPADATLALHYGITDPDVAGADSSSDYSLSVSKEFSGVNVALSYADAEEVDGAEDVDGVVFLTVSKEFEL